MMLGLFVRLRSTLKSKVDGRAKSGHTGVSSQKRPPGYRYKEYEHPTEEEHRTTEQYNWRGQFITSSFTTLFAFAAVVLTALTFVQTRRQADIAADALSDARAGSAQTLEALTAAKEEAEAATRQADVARNTEVETLRPYVSVSFSFLPVLLQDGRILTRKILHNSGKTAALSLQRATFYEMFAGDFTVAEGKLQYPTDDQVILTNSMNFIVPDGNQEITTTPQQDLREQWTRLVTENDLILVEYGMARYKDVFDHTHHLWFCSYWDGHSAVSVKCPQGNRID